MLRKLSFILLLFCVPSALMAEGLPRATPAEVGLSAEKLQALTAHLRADKPCRKTLFSEFIP